MFKTRTGTPTELGSVTICYVAIIILTRSSLIHLKPDLCLEGLPAHTPSLSPFPSVVSLHMIICPPGCHLYPFQNHEAPCSLHQTTTPVIPWPPCPCHSYHISNVTSLPPPKSLLTSQPDAYGLQFASTTAPGASPIPCSLSLCLIYQVLVCLPLVNIRSQGLGSCILQNLWRCLALPCPIHLTLSFLPHYLPEEYQVQSLQILRHSRQQDPGLHPKE